jgi:two-component system nitrate/nitrite sensor histidine kinase NarX
LRQLLITEGVQLVISTPLMAKGRTVGALDLGACSPRRISPEQLSLLAAIGHQIGVAVENARLYEQAKQLAIMEERGRLARELHDAVTQTLFSASLIAQTLPALWETDQDEGRRLVRELRRLTRAALAEMRALLLELRPAALGEASLGHLLRQLADTVAGRTGIPVEVTVDGECALPDDVHIALYRIAQEALNNVVKHSQAEHVRVDLHCSPPVEEQAESGPAGETRTDSAITRHAEVSVLDDGRGFDPIEVRPGQLGLQIMQERALSIGADLEIRSASGSGTQIRVTWNDVLRAGSEA